MTKRLGILGPGVLGRSLAQWAAECGLEVRLLGRDRGHAQQARMEIERRWEASVRRGHLPPETRDAARNRLSTGGWEPAALDHLDVLLEALPEEPALKGKCLEEAGRWASRDLLILTGTSSLPISPLAALAGLQGRLIGFHLFVPVARMPVVELVVPEEVSEDQAAAACRLAEVLRKRVVRTTDQAGFAAARMALAQGLEAIRLLEAGVASAEDLDALMTLGYGHPVGPLELSDRIGLDLRLRIAEGLYAATGDTRFQPPDLLREMVARGETGFRSGRGFYTWDASGKRT